MPHLISFVVVIAVQIVALAAVELNEYLFNRNDRDDHRFWQAVAGGVLGGVALGVIFDELIGGNLGLFQYYIQFPGFMIVNGAFSYGLAIATTLRFSPKPIRAGHLPLRRGFFVLAIACTASLGFFLCLPSPLTLAVLVGCIVVAADEAIEVWIFGTVGPILEVASGSFRHLAHNWITAVLVGASYEFGNYLFPVWRWWFATDPAALWFELAVVMLGYLVLLHFCRIVGLVALLLVRRLSTGITERA